MPFLKTKETNIVFRKEVRIKKFRKKSGSLTSSNYYVPFGTNAFWIGMNPLIPIEMCRIVPKLFFYKNGFGNK